MYTLTAFAAYQSHISGQVYLLEFQHDDIFEVS
jgi:hypothetical protein